MKVLKKNVYWGTKSICTKHSSEIIGGSADCFIGGTTIEGDPVARDVVLIKVGPNDYREATDLYEASKTFLPLPKSAILKIAMPRYDTKPRGVGELYVEDLKAMYCFINKKDEKEKVSLEELALIAKSELLKGTVKLCERETREFIKL